MKNYLIIIIAAVVVVVGTTLYFVNRSSGPAAPEPSVSVSPSASVSVSSSPASSATKTPKPTGSLSPTPTQTVSSTPTPSASSSPTPSATPTPTPTPTATLIISEAKAYAVVIQSLTFNPTPLTVKQGDIVTFQNMDNFVHTVKARSLTFVSPNIPINSEWTLETANIAPGTYDYFSTTHPTATGTLVIE